MLVEQGGEEIECSHSTLGRMKTLSEIYQTMLEKGSGRNVRIPVPVGKHELCVLLELMTSYTEEYQPSAGDNFRFHFADLVSAFEVRGCSGPDRVKWGLGAPNQSCAVS